MATETASQKSAASVGALLRARIPVILVQSPEEQRVEVALREAAVNANHKTLKIWDCVAGVTAPGGDVIDAAMTDIISVLKAITDSRDRELWILRDVAPFLKMPEVTRALRNLSKLLSRTPKEQARAIIIVQPDGSVPPELSDHVVTVKWTLPDRAEMANVFDGAVRPVAKTPDEFAAVREAAIDAAVGLSTEAANNAYSTCLVTQGRKIIPSIIAAEKKRVINRGKGVEWFDPDPRGLDALGGLEVLKPWLLQRRDDFSQEARDFGLPAPKGVILVGHPGCGKSLASKAIATAFGCPLLRGDVGAAQSKWVGESQANIREMFSIAEAIGRCVFWIDEAEKAFAGASQGAADGGVSSDALGTFLQWMQERKGEVFVIATANDVSKLPPEMLRKGRFDDLFFIDLPTAKERRDIVKVCLTKCKRADHPVDVAAVADACRDFTGAEIDALFPDALRAAFRDGKRELRTDDLLSAAKLTVPLAKTAAEKIKWLREWAKTRARPASAPEETGNVDGSRDLDV